MKKNLEDGVPTETLVGNTESKKETKLRKSGFGGTWEMSDEQLNKG